MAYERDFLLRQLNAFAQALAEAIGLRDQGKILESLYQLDDLIRADKDARELIDLPLDQFIERIDFMQNFDPRKWALISEAIAEKANLMDLAGQSEPSRAYRIKAMHLALEVLLSDAETYRGTTRDILQQLRDAVPLETLPQSTKLLLAEFLALEN